MPLNCMTSKTTTKLAGGLLRSVGLGHSDGEVANACNHANTLGNRDRTASIEQIEQVRTLQAKVVGCEHREAFEGRLYVLARLGGTILMHETVMGLLARFQFLQIVEAG